MTKKEIKNLAKRIVEAELKRKNAKNKKEKDAAELEILNLSKEATTLEDMISIDEYIQTHFKKIFWLLEIFLI